MSTLDDLPRALDLDAVRLPDQAARYRAEGWWRGTTFSDDLRDLAAADPGRPALVTGRDGEVVTLGYGELDRAVDRFAAGLTQMDPPVRVLAYQLPDWWETLALVLACIRAGVVAVPLLPVLGEREVRRALALTGADTLVTRGGPQAETAERAVQGLPGFHRLVVHDGPNALAAAGLDLDAAPLPRTVDPDRTCLVLFTSGTTGRAKAVLHSPNTLYAGGTALARAIGVGKQPVIAGASTVSHIAGLGFTLLAPLATGGTGVFQDTPDPGALLSLLEASGAQHLFATTMRLPDIAREQRAAPRRPDALRDVLTGATTPTAALVEDAETAFPGVAVRAAFASTETCLVAMVPPGSPAGTSAHSDGLPVEGLEITTPDSADGIARLRVRGPSVCLATGDAAGLHPTADHDGGWYSNGDLMRHTTAGQLRYVARTSEWIGVDFLVPARDVEDVLHRHPAVAEAVLVGIPDGDSTEQVCAVVVPNGPAPDLDRLRAHLTEHGVTSWHQPTLLRIVEAIPRDHLGKPRRADLRA